MNVTTMRNYISILLCFLFCANLTYAETTCTDADIGNGGVCTSDQPAQSNQTAQTDDTEPSAGNIPTPTTPQEQDNSSQAQTTNTASTN
jgi:hypothetical protein